MQVLQTYKLCKWSCS